MMKQDGNLFGDDLPLVPAPVHEIVVLQEVTPADLGLRCIRAEQFDVIVADSRKFAKVFRKQHKHVLRDIDETQEKMSSKLRASFFCEATYFDEYNRQVRCVDLTKRGALVLGAHYDPMIAVAIVGAFEAMANELGERSAQHVQPVFDVIEEAMQRWHARIEQTVNETVTHAVAPIVEALEWVQDFLNRQRVKLSSEDKRTHRGVIKMFFGGNCPCCQLHQILDLDGQIILNENGTPVADYDHTKLSAIGDLQHTWLICTGHKESCHYKMTHGPKATEFRLHRDHAWCNYQRRVIDYCEKMNSQGELLLQKDGSNFGPIS